MKQRVSQSKEGYIRDAQLATLIMNKINDGTTSCQEMI
jgi:hypothetical protein